MEPDPKYSADSPKYSPDPKYSYFPVLKYCEECEECECEECEFFNKYYSSAEDLRSPDCRKRLLEMLEEPEPIVFEVSQKQLLEMLEEMKSSPSKLQPETSEKTNVKRCSTRKRNAPKRLGFE